MRALDIAVLLWLVHISIIMFGGLFELNITINPSNFNETALLPSDIQKENIFSLEKLLSTVLSFTATLALAGGAALFITERGAAFIIGILMFAGVSLTLMLLSQVIPPVFALGNTLNSISVLVFGIPLPSMFITAVNGFMLFITFIAVVDVIAGRRLRDYGT
ncbi:MAG: hypothetical protein QXR02_06585 [Acidilobaceae archaeon]